MRADVDLEPLHREVLDGAVGERGLDRLAELVAQVRIGLANTQAFALAPDRTDDLGTGEVERAVGGLEGIGEIDGIVEAEVDAAVLQVEVAVGTGLVFADLGNIAEIVIDELGIDGRRLMPIVLPLKAAFSASISFTPVWPGVILIVAPVPAAFANGLSLAVAKAAGVAA